MIKYNLKQLNQQAKEEKLQKAGIKPQNPIFIPKSNTIGEQYPKMFNLEEPTLKPAKD